MSSYIKHLEQQPGVSSPKETYKVLLCRILSILRKDWTQWQSDILWPMCSQAGAAKVGQTCSFMERWLLSPLQRASSPLCCHSHYLGLISSVTLGVYHLLFFFFSLCVGFFPSNFLFFLCCFSPYSLSFFFLTPARSAIISPANKTMSFLQISQHSVL